MELIKWEPDKIDKSILTCDPDGPIIDEPHFALDYINLITPPSKLEAMHAKKLLKKIMREINDKTI